MTAIEVGSSTTYPVQIPSTGDPADIQAALKTLVYGTTSTPGSDSAILANSVFGYIRDKLATKANPVFTGGVTIGSSGSNANLTVNGNILVSGVIDTSGGTTTSFLDSALTVSSASTTDNQMTGSGFRIGSGNLAKSILWNSVTGWSASDSLNVPSGSVYKINGTMVLSSETVLGIAATNIVKKDANNTFTGSNTFSGGKSQNINGLIIDGVGQLSRNLINNELGGPVVVTSPAPYVYYNVASTSHTGWVYLGFAFAYDDGNGNYYGYHYWGEALSLSMTPGSLLVGDTINASSLSRYSGKSFIIGSVGSNYIEVYTPNSMSEYIYQVFGLSTDIIPPAVQGSVSGFVRDTLTGDERLQSWDVSGYEVAKVDRSGNFTTSGVSSASSFIETNKTYHTNASVPRFDINVTSGNLFSVTVAPDSSWNATTASSSTSTVSGKWHAFGPASPTISSNGNMTYATESGFGLVTIAQTGIYNISAAATVSSTAVTGTMLGIYTVSSGGVKSVPTYVSNIGVSNITGTINATMYLTAGQKVGFAVKTASALAVALKNTDGSFRFSGYLVG